jgi:hypothetical protein
MRKIHGRRQRPWASSNVGGPWKKIDLCLFTGRMLHDVDQLRMLLLETHVTPHRGVAVRVKHRRVRTQVLPDALRRQPLAETGFDLLTVGRRQPRRPVGSVRVGRQVGRRCFAIIGRHLGAGGQVGRS